MKNVINLMEKRPKNLIFSIPKDKKTVKIDQTSHHSDISEFVGGSDGVVVEYASGSDPSGMCIVGEHDKLIFLSLVSYGVD